MICPSCGKNIPDGLLFCTKCGAKLDNQSGNTPINYGPADTGSGPIKHTKSSSAKEPFVWKDMYTYIAIVAVVALAAVAGLIFKMRHQGGGSETAEDSYVAETQTQQIQQDVQETTGSFTEGDTAVPADIGGEGSLDSGASEMVDPRVESVVLNIRDKYNDTIDKIRSGYYERYTAPTGEDVYAHDGELGVIVVPAGVDGAQYTMYLYYENSQFYFGYYEGDDAHRFYYDGSELVRWRYSPNASDDQYAVDHDLENSNEFDRWENAVWSDSAYYMGKLNKVYTANNDYILLGSDSRYLDMSDLRGLSADECRLARNELYARHGRRFSDDQLQAYFNSKDWYDGYIDPSDFQESMLNDYETYNRDLIVEYEKEMGYR